MELKSLNESKTNLYINFKGEIHKCKNEKTCNLSNTCIMLTIKISTKDNIVLQKPAYCPMDGHKVTFKKMKTGE